MALSFPTSRRRAGPPAAYCPACGDVVPQTPRQNCCTCEALAEVLAVARARRSIDEPHNPAVAAAPSPPYSSPPVRPVDRRPHLDQARREKPAEYAAVLANLTDNHRRLHELWAEAGRSMGEIARAGGVRRPGVSTAIARMLRHFEAAGVLPSSRATTGTRHMKQPKKKSQHTPPGKADTGTRRGQPMPQTRTPATPEISATIPPDAVAGEVPEYVPDVEEGLDPVAAAALARVKARAATAESFPMCFSYRGVRIPLGIFQYTDRAMLSTEARLVPDIIQRLRAVGVDVDESSLMPWVLDTIMSNMPTPEQVHKNMERELARMKRKSRRREARAAKETTSQ